MQKLDYRLKKSIFSTFDMFLTLIPDFFHSNPFSSYKVFIQKNIHLFPFSDFSRSISTESLFHPSPTSILSFKNRKYSILRPSSWEVIFYDFKQFVDCEYFQSQIQIALEAFLNESFRHQHRFWSQSCFRKPKSSWPSIRWILLNFKHFVYFLLWRSCTLECVEVIKDHSRSIHFSESVFLELFWWSLCSLVNFDDFSIVWEINFEGYESGKRPNRELWDFDEVKVIDRHC
jgi:hypothetical protein